MDDRAPSRGRYGPSLLLDLEGPELSNPLDPSSTPTGDTIFVLEESYVSPAGIAEHWSQAQQAWQDLGPFVEWSARCKVYTLHAGTVIQAVW